MPYLLETDAENNCVGIHRTLVSASEWKPNSANLYEVGEEIFNQVYQQPEKWLYDGNNLIPRVQLTVPALIQSGQQVEISASIPGVEGMEGVLYIDGVEQARSVLPFTWQVIFEASGEYIVEVRTTTNGKRSRRVMVQ